jgi:hypothetical protein
MPLPAGRRTCLEGRKTETPAPRSPDTKSDILRHTPKRLRCMGICVAAKIGVPNPMNVSRNDPVAAIGVPAFSNIHDKVKTVHPNIRLVVKSSPRDLTEPETSERRQGLRPKSLPCPKAQPDAFLNLYILPEGDSRPSLQTNVAVRCRKRSLAAALSRIVPA